MDFFTKKKFFCLLLLVLFACSNQIKEEEEVGIIADSTESQQKSILTKEYRSNYLKHLLETTHFNEKKWVTFSPEQEVFNQTTPNVNRTDLVGERSPILKIKLYKKKTCPRYKNTLNGISSLKIGVCNWGNEPTSGTIILNHHYIFSSFGLYHNATTTGNWSLTDIDSLTFSLDEVLNPGNCSSSLIEINFLYLCADKNCFQSEFVAYNPETDTISKNETYTVECRNLKPGPLSNTVQIQSQESICLNDPETNNFTVEYSSCNTDNQIALEGYFYPTIADSLVQSMTIDSYITPTPDSPICYFNCTNDSPIQLMFGECITSQQGFVFTPQYIPYSYKAIVFTLFQSYNESDPIVVSPYIEIGVTCGIDPGVSVVTLPPNKAPIVGII